MVDIMSLHNIPYKTSPVDSGAISPLAGARACQSGGGKTFSNEGGGGSTGIAGRYDQPSSQARHNFEKSLFGVEVRVS